MIHEIILPLQQELNKFLRSKHGLNEDKVILSNLMNVDGSLAIQETDKIVMSIVNIEQDRSKSNTGSYEKTDKGDFIKVNAPVNIQIYVLYSAYFTPENYLEGIKFISSTIAFFQSRSGVFDPQNTPTLNGVIDRLYSEMIPMEFRDLSNVWSLVGAKYLPSVLYKFKAIPIQHRMPTPVIPYIKNT
jgi:hypothetical protein